MCEAQIRVVAKRFILPRGQCGAFTGIAREDVTPPKRDGREVSKQECRRNRLHHQAARTTLNLSFPV